MPQISKQLAFAVLLEQHPIKAVYSFGTFCGTRCFKESRVYSSDTSKISYPSVRDMTTLQQAMTFGNVFACEIPWSMGP